MRVATLLAVVAATLLAGAAPAGARLAVFEGAVHEHTAYSDGQPGTRPADAFAAVRGHGGDFMFSTEHSDTLDLPIVVSEDCLSERLPECAIADQRSPGDSLRKWDAIAEQADAATGNGFVGVRGFEWTSDRFGHINVLFSENHTNAKLDGGYVTMAPFWNWFTTPVAQGGGDDALAIFNHPGRSEELGALPGGDWDAFAHVPAADARMVGIELFNGGGDYGTANEVHAAGSYGEALDNGWHVGAIGAEDTHDTAWGRPTERKTVILSHGLSRDGLREALEARRFYAIHHSGVRMDFTASGSPMGSRVTVGRRRDIAFRASTNEPGATLELVTSGGRTVATAAGDLLVRRRAAADERWYVVRVRDAGGRSVAYSSPIWVSVAP